MATADEIKHSQSMDEKGLNAPRVKPEDLDAMIAKEQYEVCNGILTICVLTLRNGYMIVGHAAPASKDNFDEQVGRELALKDARSQMWPLMGFHLREKLYSQEQPTTSEG